jgi:hypothetical protein
MVSMTKFATFAAAAMIAATAGIAAAPSAADARPKKAPASTCKAPLRGSATGQGILGKGTAQARAAARYDWESRATRAYGDAYGNFDKSKGKSFDCKKGAILKAKCVVVSRPCK